MPKNNLPTAKFIVPMCGPPNIYLLPAEVGALKLNGIKCRVQVRLFWGWGVDGANFSLWLNLIDYAYAALSLPGKI